MTRLLGPDAALARVPGLGGNLEWREIKGGLTNRSYAVRAGNRRFVLRLDAEHTASFGLDRTTEARILDEAARASLAPEIHYSNPEAGILVCKFLPGPVWSRDLLDETDNLDRLAALLRRVHELPGAGVLLDTVAAARRYQRVASRHADLKPHAGRLVDIVRTIPRPAIVKCCHNDVAAGNIVGIREPVLLDWEYAADNDPYFDLASLIAYHDLDAAHGRKLLQAYEDGLAPESQERLELQVRLYDALQWLWLAARYVFEPNPHHRSRLEQLRKRIP